MAVIRISEAEAVRDVPALLAKVRTDNEVLIDDQDRTIAVLRSPDETPARRSLSERFALRKNADPR